MRWTRRRRREEIPQASLADMAFLLLIFFIATTTFAVEVGLPLVNYDFVRLCPQI